MGKAVFPGLSRVLTRMRADYRDRVDTGRGRALAWLDSMVFDHGFLRLVIYRRRLVTRGIYRSDQPNPWHLRAAARDEAAAEIERRRQEAEAEARRTGEAQGRDEGRRQGREEVLASLAPQFEAVTEGWRAALGDWAQWRETSEQQMRRDVIALALAIARKVVLRHVRLEPDLVVEQVHEVLSLVGRPTALEVIIHPEDRPLVEEAMANLAQDLGGDRHVSLRDDPEIARGGCIVRTAGGEVDATIDGQLDRIAATLLPESDGSST